MINLIIYLKKEHNPTHLLERLFKEELIGMASMDENNETIILKDGKLTKLIHTVVTIQTRAILFSMIKDIVESEFGEEVLINSLPIAGTNRSFENLMKETVRRD